MYSRAGGGGSSTRDGSREKNVKVGRRMWKSGEECESREKNVKSREKNVIKIHGELQFNDDIKSLQFLVSSINFLQAPMAPTVFKRSL
jgi:hypothetical protein